MTVVTRDERSPVFGLGATVFVTALVMLSGTRIAIYQTRQPSLFRPIDLLFFKTRSIFVNIVYFTV